MSRASPSPLRICFVCLGNICRSPTAEGVFRQRVETAGLTARILIDSAGTASYHTGARADARSRLHAERRGYRLDSLARQFSVGDFARFDYVLAMDAQNLSNLRELGEPGSTHLGLFRDFDATAGPGQSVPDPYYGGDAGFEEVLDQCERAADGLLLVLKRRLESRS